MKKRIAIFLVALLGFSMVATSAYAAYNQVGNKPIVSAAENATAIQNMESQISEDALKAALWSSDEFRAHYADDPLDAIAAMKRMINACSSFSFDTVALTSDDVAAVSVALVQQPNGYSCGPTSSYMAITGWNGAGLIEGNIATEKINTLAKEMGTDSSGTFVYQVRDGLNRYTNNQQNYAYYLGSGLTEQQFRLYTFNSLSYKRAPILHARTEHLSYYNGHKSGHYITVTEFDYTTSKVRLHDPNNNNDYFGIYYVPYEEAYKSISADGRYYICYWP